MTSTEPVRHRWAGDNTEWELSPWPLAFELATLFPEGTWTLVGGLMVRARALIHDVPPSRATSDVDVTISLLRNGGVRYQQFEELLRSVDFQPDGNTRLCYRYRRGRDIVDLMFPDGVPARLIPEVGGRRVLTVPAGRHVTQNREILEVPRPGAQPVRLYVPTLRASLVAKGAAYLADSRERNRHLSDFITLLACVEDAAEMREGLSARSRKRVRVALRALGEPSSREVWARAESVTRTLAEEIMHDMNLAFDTTGTTGR